MAVKKQTKSHRRKSDQTQTSVSLSEKALELGRQMAADDDRSFSNFVERLLLEAAKAAGKISLIAILGAHLFRAPSDWSPGSMLATGKAGLAMIAGLF